MPKLTDQEKAERARQRHLLTATAKGATSYKNDIVAPLFQRMIRAEFGSDPREFVTAVVNGKLRQVRRRIGQVVCVTCGDVYPWTHPDYLINTGHFLGRDNSILFEETNVAPQCARCNDHGYGQRDRYRLYVAFMHGEAEVERLEKLKPTSRSFSKEELVDLRIEYAARLKAAERKMSDSR